MKISRALNQVPAIVYLWAAILIFAASSSVTRKIIELGNTNLINGRNPISLCNVLLVGNICALLIVGVIFHRDWTVRKLRQLTRSNWISLTLIALLSGALGPALIFTALDKTNVTNVILIGRLEPILTLFFGIWLLGSRVTRWTVAGSLISFLGVVLTILGGRSSPMVMMGIHLGQGELLALAGALVYSTSTLISRRYLGGIPLGIISVYRNLVGTAIFFVLANVLYGPHHFAEAFSPFLWRWMLIYAALIVVTGQLCSLRGVMGSTAAEISLANSFSPIAGIIFAYLILGEVPTASQYRAASLVILGIILSLIGNLKLMKTSPSPEMNMGTGFKGV